MSDTQTLYDTVEIQRQRVTALDDELITKTAKDVAYYFAMLYAAECDPLDDVEEQRAVVTRIKTRLTQMTEVYMLYVNEKL